jgi:hypothetical protein
VVSARIEHGDAAQGPHRWVKLEEAGDSEEGGAGDPSREAVRAQRCLNGSTGRH